MYELLPQVLSTAIVILFLLASLGRILHWLYLWQIKEYRIDRFRDYVHTQSGHDALLNKWLYVEAVLMVVAFVLFMWIDDSQMLLNGTMILIALYLLVQLARYARWRVQPVWTSKISLLLIANVCISLSIVYLSWETALYVPVLVLTYLLLPIIVTFTVLLLEPVAYMQKQRIISVAAKKIQQYDPIVIGITGSYGKSTTKEFMKTILSERYSVFATPKNVNVDIGVAQVVNHKLTPQDEVCIIEMGAYRKGEIAKTAAMVKPIVGVITAVSNQHLSLFGTLDDLKKAKAELLDALPSSGLAVINYDSAGAQAIADHSQARVKYYSLDDHAHVYATNVQVASDHLAFTLHIGKQEQEVTAPLHGKQSIPSILAATAVADYLGLTIEQIAAGISRLEPIDGTMHLRAGNRGSSIIDDSYNASPESFVAALDFLETFAPQRKTVVTVGMHELGDSSDDEHRRIGMRIGQVADRLIVLKKDFYGPLVEGALMGGLPQEMITLATTTEAQQLALEDMTEQDIVLIEGRVPAPVLEYLTHEQPQR